MTPRIDAAKAMAIDASVAVGHGFIDIFAQAPERGEWIFPGQAKALWGKAVLCRLRSQLVRRFFQKMDECAQRSRHHRRLRTRLPPVLQIGAIKNAESEKIFLVVEPDDNDRLVRLNLLSFSKMVFVSGIWYHQIVNAIHPF